MILDRYSSFQQYPQNIPAVLKAFKSNLSGSAKYKDSEYLFLHWRLLEILKLIQHLAQFLVEKTDKHEQWGKMMRDIVKMPAEYHRTPYRR